jgi:hypothetical protein
MNQDIFMKINDYVELKRRSESDAAIYWQRNCYGITEVDWSDWTEQKMKEAYTKRTENRSKK